MAVQDSPAEPARGQTVPAAMILAAGLGTRLRPLTDRLPKPLVPIGDRAALAHIAERLARAGVLRVVVNTHHRAEAFGAAELSGAPVERSLSHEPSILGTAGGVAKARELLGDGDVLVQNGDILADVDYGALLASHRSSGAAATLAVCARPTGPGTVGIGVDGRVVRLREERYGREHRAADFAGIQVLSPAMRDRLPREGCLVADLYQPALREGLSVRVADVVSGWIDVGSLAGYLQANLAWLHEGGRDNFVADDARIDSGVQLDQSVVGAGAQVLGVGRLCRCVVWPGAVATAPLDQAVVLPPHTVVPAH